MEETQRGFRFLDLPGEIRNMIYKTLLVKPDPLLVPRCDILPWRHHWLALLRANKQIHHEAASIMYGFNTFVLDRPLRWFPLSGFLERIGPVNGGHLRKLIFDFLNVGTTISRVGEVDRFEELTVLRKCTNLETLQTNSVMW